MAKRTAANSFDLTFFFIFYFKIVSGLVIMDLISTLNKILKLTRKNVRMKQDCPTCMDASHKHV